jgi:hypothetical protein
MQTKVDIDVLTEPERFLIFDAVKKKAVPEA